MNIRNLLVCSCWALSSKTCERNYTRDIRACANSLVPEKGNGKIKMKRECVWNGPFHSSSVQLPFNTRLPPVIFLKRRAVVRIEGNFFFTPIENTVYCKSTQTVPQINNNFIEIVIYHIFSIISHNYNKFQLGESVTSI